ncbi:MAG: hypothetical protein UX94_C0012G0004 [Parcubacteria group bacterium GW2011_GWA2_47_21]|nr:MAG: hypothetical protein UX94_C0012G0004 [Parcubacteria group bacterium GW2011_GWA2_47_21]
MKKTRKRLSAKLSSRSFAIGAGKGRCIKNPKNSPDDRTIFLVYSIAYKVWACSFNGKTSVSKTEVPSSTLGGPVCVCLIIMIEIEKNFEAGEEMKKRIIDGAEFLGRKTITDVYYDVADFRLTRNDYWLRQRDGRFELKVPVRGVKTRDGGIDRYTELESDDEIIQELKLPTSASIAESLNKQEILPFARIVTDRETYRKGEFHLDFDEMDFGFVTFEVELMVTDESEIPAAEIKIEEFAKSYGISSTKARGKVIEYIFRRNPKHFRALERVGVIREG